MNPVTAGDGLRQLGMYILATGGAIATEIGGQNIMTYLIGASTLVLIWSNVLLNRKKSKQFDKTGSTKPPIPRDSNKPPEAL